MTQHIPSYEQWEEAAPHLRNAANEATYGLRFDIKMAHKSFLKAAAALGYTLQPPVQVQGDLVKRLHHNAEWRSKSTGIQKEKLVEWQAAAHIEALEAAAAKTRVATHSLGFASFKDGTMELIIQDHERNTEITISKKLDPGEQEKIWEVLPTCVFVEAAAVQQSEREAALVKALKECLATIKNKEGGKICLAAT